VDRFLDAFLPLFVAIDVVGILPIFMSLTDGMTPAARRRLALQGVGTALALALLLVFAGQAFFRVLGITVDDLRVGGGLILLVLAITDLLFGEYRQRAPDANALEGSERGHAPDVGIVPLGIPLVFGPAAITTLLVAQPVYGYAITVAALVANLALVVAVFFAGPWLIARLGKNTAKAVAKIANLFLAAIAVAMIRVGIVNMAGTL